MKIELLTELSFENETPPEIIEINIDENSSIGELLSKVHELRNIPAYTELKWNDTIEKVSCRYYFKSGIELDDYTVIKNLDEKIYDFPKYGASGELLIFINGETGLVN
jgi:hypothetical protein